jgi:hypothetical protein
MGCGQSGANVEAPSTGAGVVEAIQKGNAALVRKAIIAHPGLMTFKDGSEKTLLHHAAVSDMSGQCLEALLERPGIDMNAVDMSGSSALHGCAAV